MIVADDGLYAEKRDMAIVECLEATCGVTETSVLVNSLLARSGKQSCLTNYFKSNLKLPGNYAVSKALF